jgi:LysM repeat protein
VAAEPATQEVPPQTVATGGDGSGHHRVRSGQTLTDIARHYGTTVPALTRENGIRNARSLRAGQVLTVPGSARVVVPATASDGTPALAAATPEHPAGATPEVAAADAAVAPSAAAPQDPSATAEPGDAAPETAGADDAAELTAAPPPPNDALIAPEHALDAALATDESAAVEAAEAGPEPMAAVASAPDAQQQHRVQPGQTLSDIAKAYGTTVPALIEHNGIRDARDLRAGQVLEVPAGTGSNSVLAALRSDAGYFHHRVRRGQTLSDIAKQYGTSVSTLQRYNGIRDARRLQARQVIRIPTS